MPNKLGMFGIVCTAVLVGTQLPLMWKNEPSAFGQYPPNMAAPQVVVRQQSELPKWIVDFAPYELPGEPGRKIRVITVVDSELKKISVYHEELATGKIWWLSTRNIQPDLQVDQFNATSPLPSDVSKEIKRLQKTHN